MRSSLQIGLSVLLLLAVAAPGLAEQIDNPQFQSWSKFKPGTTITVVTVTESSSQKTQIEKTTTLLKVAADKVVIEEKQLIEVSGQKIKQGPSQTTVPAKIDKDAGIYDGVHGGDSAKKPETKESTVELEVAGKKIKCKLVEANYGGNDSSLVVKTWTSDEVPGKTVKSETKMAGPDAASSVTTAITITAMDIK